MTTALIALGVVIGLVGLWGVLTYNSLVRDRNLMQEAWSGIDVQLKRRHDLVPNIVEVVRGYGRHERTVLEEVTQARARSVEARDLPDRQASENTLTDRLRSLLAVVEAYPDLKADRAFLNLQRQLVEVEDQIQMARRYYNGAVRNYNIRIQSAPALVIAAFFGFRPAEFFQVGTATERLVPKVEM
jgi:LemA protein